VNEYLYLEDDRIVDVLLAAYIANQVIDADPIWLLIIASSSNAKTELLRTFDGLDDAYFLSELTEKTFVSGDKNPKGGQNPSLLYRLNNKVLVFKDFTTVLSMYREKRSAIIAQMREIADGKFTKAFGTGDEIDWKGKVGFLGACTHIYFKHHAVINTMGERFLIYRNDSKDYIRMGKKAAEMTGRETEFRNKIRTSIHKYCKQFKNIKVPGRTNVRVQPKIDDKIIHLAKLVAVARTGVDRERSSRTLSYTPHPEGPGRLIKQLKVIAIGLALAHGKSNITKPIFKIVKKIASDAIPELRMEVLQFLWDENAIQNDKDDLSTRQKKWIRTSDVATEIKKPTSSVLMVLEDLMTLRIVNRKIDDFARGERERNKPYLWQISWEIYQSINETDFFDQ
jgi:hypothetical protein